MVTRVRHFMVTLIAGVLATGLATSPLSAQVTRDLPTADVLLERAATPVPTDASNAPMSVLAERAPVALQSARMYRDSTERELPAPAPRASHGSNLALMGVGGAAVVVGLLVGGDAGAAVAIGGGVVGLIGLYRYLR